MSAVKVTARGVRTRHGLLLVTGLAAALPILVSMGERVAVDWVPLADNAVIAVRSLDVLSTHPPLLGQWSSGPSQVVEADVYAPGPLLYWLLALPARLPGAIWLELTMGLVNLACVLGAVALAHRRGGRALMFAVALAVALMLGSVPAETLSDLWNPTVPLVPFTLLIFLCWSLACGEYRLLPLTALVASFVLQGHLAYVFAGLGVLAVGLLGLALSGQSLRRDPARRWVLAAAAGALVCFSAPAVEQAIHRPGNVVRLAQAATADDPTLGYEMGWHTLVRAIGIPPWWLRDATIPIQRVGEVSNAPGAGSIASALLALAALVAACVVGRRRRRADVVAAGALGLVLCAAIVFAAASTPRSSFAGVGYTLRWTSPAGMWVWLALGWSAAVLALPRIRPSAWAPHPGLVSIACVGAVAVAGAFVAIRGEAREEPFAEMRAIAEELERELPTGPTTRVDAVSSQDTFFMALDFQAGIVYWLRREGRPVVAPDMAEVLGSRYGTDGPEAEQVVLVNVATRPPERGRVLARLTVPEHHDPEDPFAPEVERRRLVSVTLLPAGDAR
jgi:hypothetical protein